MPIYEFYCERCHTIYNFFTAVSSEQRPSCPRCGRPDLPRRPSTFAISGGAGEDEEPLFEGVDESRLEGAMGALMGEIESLGDDPDPRSIGRLLHRFGDLSGLELGPRMEDMLARLDAGEDLDTVEADFDTGAADDEGLEDLFRLKRRLLRSRRPRVDEEMYFL